MSATLDALLSLPDRAWETAQRRWPVLYRLDDRNWKTWCWHSVIALVLGHLIAMLPGISLAGGLILALVFYAAREIAARLAFGWQYKPLDGLMDVLIPAIVCATWFHLGLP